ncbi:MATE family efflux transporter [Desulfitobacterium chlororespirans]|uniref:Putative efflux protein, MATE family n=1 Tax=Desulfitobacterium chlororespirans DSM 11544 TaxID=1121395 RepID=A0A1M7ULS8_9FIRM|nr:MATE family efflux transporter [Desulfitobacterium chlororespirans]SHN83847.1 putative efflux protein, MATE family [Desulfitobacterium chlororespirans DSM 11544]
MEENQSMALKPQTMTQGPIGRQIIIFSLPLLGSSLIQQLYNTVDLIFVGRFLNPSAAAAVGAGSLLVFCALGIFIGLSVGTGVVTARYLGAGDYERVNKTIHTAMAMSIYGGAVFTLLGIGLAPLLLKLLNTPQEIMAQATLYIRIYFCGFMAMSSYNMGAGILRALGDSKSPMIYQLIGGLGNVGANFLFIPILGWGVGGSAVATLCSQTVAALLVFLHLVRGNRYYRLRLKGLSIAREYGGRILAVGIPAGIQGVVVTLSNLLVQSHINTLSINSIAAFTAYFRVELFIYLPILAISQTAGIFAGHNIGAGKLNRVRKGTRVCLAIGVITAVSLSGSVLLMGEHLFALFTNSKAVVAIGLELAKVTFPFYFIYVFLEIFASVVRGAGKAIPPMIIILVTLCGLRLILVNVFMHLWPSATSVAVVYPLTWLTAALALGGYYFLGKWGKQEG